MKRRTLPLVEINALVTEPSTSLGVEGLPDVAIISVRARGPDWSTELDRVVSGSIVLGFKKILLDLREADVMEPFQIVCIVSAWHLLVEVGGTLAMSGLSATAFDALRQEYEPDLFNIFEDMDQAIAWIDSGYEMSLKSSFPRTARCKACGTEGKVQKRGDYLCDECGMTYMVTERGELPF